MVRSWASSSLVLDLVSGLKKVAIFWSLHNVALFSDMREELFAIIIGIKDAVFAVPTEAMKYSILGCYYSFKWDFNQLPCADAVFMQENPLRQNLNTYFLLLKELVGFSDVAVHREEVSLLSKYYFLVS